jgi:hypothetical protein
MDTSFHTRVHFLINYAGSMCSLVFIITHSLTQSQATPCTMLHQTIMQHHHQQSIMLLHLSSIKSSSKAPFGMYRRMNACVTCINKQGRYDALTGSLFMDPVAPCWDSGL